MTCDITSLPEANCGHCADFHDFLRGEALPPSGGDAAVELLKDALFLRMYGERPPGAPPGNPKAETWAEWDRRCEGFLRARQGLAEAEVGRPAVVREAAP